MIQAAREQTDVTHHTEIILECAVFIVHAINATKASNRPVAARRAASTAQVYREMPASEWVEQGIDAADTDSTEAIGRFGRARDVRLSFPSVAQLVARHEDDFRGALVANAEAGVTPPRVG